MDPTRVFIILQKIMKNIPDEILLMIIDIYKTHEYYDKCVLCGETRENNYKGEKGKYEIYCDNADQLFGEDSWKICYKCWNSQPRCDDCQMPIKTKLPWLQKTTYVIPSRNKKGWFCDDCWRKTFQGQIDYFESFNLYYSRKNDS